MRTYYRICWARTRTSPLRVVYGQDAVEGGGRSSRRLVMISVSCSPYVVTIEMNFSGSQPCSASSSDCLWCRWKTNFRLYPIFNYMWIVFNLFFAYLSNRCKRGTVPDYTFLLMSQSIVLNGFIRISSNLIPKKNFHILQECNL